VRSEAGANNPSLNQVTESYFGAQKHHENQSPFLLTSDLNSQSNDNDNVPARQNSLGMWKYFEDGITCLEENPSSVIPTSPVTAEIFHINEISPEWAYCTENTKVFFFL
jgi:calmodulin-binding transcription activator